MGQKKKSKGKSQISLDKQNWKHDIPNYMGYTNSSSERKVYGDKHLRLKKERSQII